MAASRATRSKRGIDKTLSPGDVERELAKARERLRAEGAVRLATFKPKALKDRLVAGLAAEGFEVTRTWVRKPALEQVREALAHGALVTKKALPRLVHGVTQPELTRATAELERGGELHRVLRGKTEAFGGAATKVLAPGSLPALRGVISRLHQALGAASKKKGLKLLASDLEEALAEVQGVLNPNAGTRASAPVMPQPPDASDSKFLLDALDLTRNERTGLSFVPHVVEQLLSRVQLDVACEMLLTAARQELIELRPEGGLGRLTSAELRLCPPGPAGTRLSWARRLGVAS